MTFATLFQIIAPYLVIGLFAIIVATLLDRLFIMRQHESIITEQHFKHQDILENQRIRYGKSIGELEKHNKRLKKQLDDRSAFIQFCFDESRQVLDQLLDKFETKNELGE